jgi:hypothetical protein
VLDQAILGHHATNKIKVDPYTDGFGHIQFVTVGNNASLSIWRFDTKTEKLMFRQVQEPEMLKNTHFLTVDFTPKLPEVNTYYIVIGDSDGALVAYDDLKNSYVELGTSRGRIIDGAIGCISIKTDSIVIVSQQGLIARYPIKGSNI